MSFRDRAGNRMREQQSMLEAGQATHMGLGAHVSALVPRLEWQLLTQAGFLALRPEALPCEAHLL